MLNNIEWLIKCEHSCKGVADHVNQGCIFFYGRLVTKVDRGGQEKDPFILVSVDKKALKIIDIARAFH